MQPPQPQQGDFELDTKDTTQPLTEAIMLELRIIELRISNRVLDCHVLDQQRKTRYAWVERQDTCEPARLERQVVVQVEDFERVQDTEWRNGGFPRVRGRIEDADGQALESEREAV